MPGTPDREVAVVVALRVVVAVLVEEHRGGGRGGGLLAEVVGVGLAVGGSKEQEAAPADVARGGMGDGEGEGRGHRRVHRVAAVPERPRPHLRGQGALRDHHAPPGADHLGGAGERRDGEGKGDEQQGGTASLQGSLPGGWVGS